MANPVEMGVLGKMQHPFHLSFQFNVLREPVRNGWTHCHRIGVVPLTLPSHTFKQHVDSGWLAVPSKYKFPVLKHIAHIASMQRANGYSYPKPSYQLK
jgi:hypothetical protein